MSHIMETVHNVCMEVRQKTNQNTSFQKLISKIRKEFKRNNFDIIFTSHRKLTLDSEEFYVNAYYDPENDSNHEKAIEVVIVHNFNKSVFWDKKHVTDLLIQIYDAVIHEFRHQKQSRKKNHKIYWPYSNIVQNYLSDPDEIDAYAYSIAIELCRSMGRYRALNYLHKFSSLSKYKIRDNYVSPNLYEYVKIFKDLNDPVLKRLAKKIYKRLLKIDTDLIFV